MGRLFPYATLGFKFPNRGSFNIDGDKASISAGAILGFIAGAYYELTESSIASAGLLIYNDFGLSYRGEESILGHQPYSRGGEFGIGLKADYAFNFEVNKLALGIKPNFQMGLTSVSYKDSRSNAPEVPSDNYFTLSLGFDTGLRYKPSDTFTFYSGVGLKFFEWNTLTRSGGGSNKTKESEWEVTGIEWDDASLYNGNLVFGMTFIPNEYITVGFGLNSILNNIVAFNLKEMTTTAGPIWGDNKGNVGSWASGFLQNMSLDLTVSLTIPQGGITPRDER